MNKFFLVAVTGFMFALLGVDQVFAQGVPPQSCSIAVNTRKVGSPDDYNYTADVRVFSSGLTERGRPNFYKLVWLNDLCTSGGPGQTWMTVTGDQTDGSFSGFCSDLGGGSKVFRVEYCETGNSCAPVPGCTTTASFSAEGEVTDEEDAVFLDKKPYDFCAQAAINGDTGSQTYVDCNRCLDRYGGPDKAVWTAFGCIPTTIQDIVLSVLTVAISISGGLALLFILFGAFTISTATSNPERLKKGQEMVVSAIAGLFFILMSVVMLQFIGVELLRLPGFAG